MLEEKPKAAGVIIANEAASSQIGESIIVDSKEYASFLSSLKEKVVSSQQRAIIQVNQQLITLYHHIGFEIVRLQKEKGWGSNIINQLSKDLTSSFPKMRGFSPRNLGYMKRFAEEYQDIEFLQAALAKLPWYHHITLLEKVKSPKEREFYIQKSLEHGWSRNILVMQIETRLYERHGKAVSNFKDKLPSPLSDMVQQSFKDPYLFDFLTLHDKAKEREIENALIENMKRFLLELGEGFAFVGSQCRLTVGSEDFYPDLLFYNVKLHCYVVIELKATDFKPGHAGQLSFYLSAIDDLLRHPLDNPTIGLILCKTKNNIIAEYALKSIDAPIGLAEYKLERAIPEDLQGILPSVAEIEAELSRPQIDKEISN